MFVCVQTVSYLGPKVLPVRVEVSLSQGRPSFTIVGLGDKAVNESRERVSASLDALGYTFPPKRITVNLSPADLTKEGTHYDLPICLGLLAVMGVIPQSALDDYIFMGELSLNGKINSISGALPAAIFAKKTEKIFVCPLLNATQIAWALPEVKGARSLTNVLDFLKGKTGLCIQNCKPSIAPTTTPQLHEIYGQHYAKKALMIAAAGRHNIMMMGPPGSGKTLLAKALIGLLPPLTLEEALATEINYNLSQTKGSENKGLFERPFRTPHHTTSGVALVGGGLSVRPGEVSLAHNGVLFLDELAEFSGKALDALREPLENQKASISRANYTATFDADFQLVGALNPCKCGYAGLPRGCGKEPSCVQKYVSRLSGPFIDRFDIFINVRPVPFTELKPTEITSTNSPLLAIKEATNIQTQRNPRGTSNARLSHTELEKVGRFSESAMSALRQGATIHRFSTRAYHRLMRVSRTIADLEKSATVERSHMLLALQYRQDAVGT